MEEKLVNKKKYIIFASNFKGGCKLSGRNRPINANQ